jgi:hypothetical protein
MTKGIEELVLPHTLTTTVDGASISVLNSILVGSKVASVENERISAWVKTSG